MTHCVAEPCIRCKFTDCVEVCPVEAFREGENFLAIDPDACIDCMLCASQCPVGAIYIENELPPKWSAWLERNARLSKIWPVITRQQDPMPGHREWARVDDKAAELSERPASRS